MIYIINLCYIFKIKILHTHTQIIYIGLYLYYTIIFYYLLFK